MRRHGNQVRRGLAALLTVLALPAAALAVGQVGDPAANFTLNAVQGGTYSMNDFDGQVRFLFFFGHG